MSRQRHQTHTDGLRGEAAFLDFAARQRWSIFRGLDGHEPYDYIVDIGGTLIRVEVKWIGAQQLADSGYYYVTATKLDARRFDYLFVATPFAQYWIPAAECPKQTLCIKVPDGKRIGKYEVFRVEAAC